MKIISIANQKGGVGKTTTTVNLAACLAAAERRVLLLDLDPQGNASSGVGLDSALTADKNIYHVLIDELPVSEANYSSDLEFLKVCPADNNLSGAEVELVSAMARELRLKNALDALRKDDAFDYVFIDCPPSLGLLTINALTASDGYLIPLQCEYYAMEGLGQFLHTVELVKKGLNRDLTQVGILLTMYDSRNNLSRQVQEEVRQHFGDNVFQTLIPRNVKLSESPSHGKPVILYDIGSSGSQSYLNLAEEVIERMEPEKLSDATTATVTKTLAEHAKSQNDEETSTSVELKDNNSEVAEQPFAQPHTEEVSEPEVSSDIEVEAETSIENKEAIAGIEERSIGLSEELIQSYQDAPVPPIPDPPPINQDINPGIQASENEEATQTSELTETQVADSSLETNSHSEEELERLTSRVESSEPLAVPNFVDPGIEVAPKEELEDLNETTYSAGQQPGNPNSDSSTELKKEMTSIEGNTNNGG